MLSASLNKSFPSFLLVPLHQIELDSRSAGWMSCLLAEANSYYVQLELRGSDQSLRVRQIKVLGEEMGESNLLPIKKTASDIQQDSCEAETLKVFRILTAQVGGV